MEAYFRDYFTLNSFEFRKAICSLILFAASNSNNLTTDSVYRDNHIVPTIRTNGLAFQ
jgi:hypothetical protein